MCGLLGDGRLMVHSISLCGVQDERSIDMCHHDNQTTRGVIVEVVFAVGSGGQARL